jgi:hypothetical protein
LRLAESGTDYVARAHAPARVAAAALHVYRHARDAGAGLYSADEAGVEALADDESRIRDALATARAGAR